MPEKKPTRRPSVGVGVLILNQDKNMLVGKRGPACKRGAGCWALPGGHVDEGESVADAIVREVWDETGLVVRPIPWIGDMPFETTGPFAITDHHGDLDHISLWYMAELDITSCKRCDLHGSIPAREPTKSHGWNWMSPAEVAKLSTATTPGDSFSANEQYYWLPIDVFRAVLPELFGPEPEKCEPRVEYFNTYGQL